MILPEGFQPFKVRTGYDRSLGSDESDRLFDRFLKQYPRIVRADGRARAKAVWHKHVQTLWQFQALERELHIWWHHWKALGWPRAAIPKPHAWLEMRTWLE